MHAVLLKDPPTENNAALFQKRGHRVIAEIMTRGGCLLSR